jgi:hypothetical protein
LHARATSEAIALRDGAHRMGPFRRDRALLGGLLVLLWIPCTIVPFGLLMAGHLLTLPKPPVDGRLRSEIESGASQRPGSWFVLHVLSEECQCSQDVLGHLLVRGAQSRFSEKVLFIGNGAPVRSRLVERGFVFESIAPEQLEARLGVEGTPLMVVANPRGEVVYMGGYAGNRWGPPQDLDVMQALAQGRTVNALPLFGCAVSRGLQERLDPLGLKYDSSSKDAH